jgi:hypothetical protein
LEDGRKLIAIYPEEEEGGDRHNDCNGDTAPVEKDVIQHDVHDHGAEQGQAERNEAPADEQKQAADDLKDRDGINVAPPPMRGDAGALAFLFVLNSTNRCL